MMPLLVSLLLTIISQLTLLLVHHDLTLGVIVTEHYFMVSVATGSS